MLAVLLLWVSGCLADLSGTMSMLNAYENAFIAQRDLSDIIPIDQLTSFGISLNKVIFDQVGYSNASLTYVSMFLDLKTSMFMLDLYWNEYTSTWQLCPAPFPLNSTLDMSRPVEIYWNNHTYTCQPSFSITDFLESFETYLSRTNLLLEANFIQLAFNLKTISQHPFNSSSSSNKTDGSKALAAESNYIKALSAMGNATLRDSLSPLSAYIFSPSEYQSAKPVFSSDSSQRFYFSSFPTQRELIYSLFKRVLPFVMSNELSNSSSSSYRFSPSDYNLLFFPNHTDFSPYVASLENETLAQEIDNIYTHSSSSSIFQSIVNGSQFRMIIDSDDTAFANESITKYLKSGFTTVLNSSNYEFDEDLDESSGLEEKGTLILGILRQFVPRSYWSWAPLQPVEFARNGTQNNSARNESWYASSVSQSAYQCVSVGQTGWSVSNCYDQMRWACKNNSNPFSWEISAEKSTFFQVNDADCPTGFSVAVPRSSIEQFSLLSLLRSRNISFPIWIDLNDITVSGCFVYGGPYAFCPYKEVLTTRSFIKSLAPSSLVALFILFLIFSEKFSSSPIHTNRRRHWRKTITNYYKENDYEGVPL